MSARIDPAAVAYLARHGVDVAAVAAQIDARAEEWRVALFQPREEAAIGSRQAPVSIRTVRLLRGRDGVWRLDRTEDDARRSPAVGDVWVRPDKGDVHVVFLVEGTTHGIAAFCGTSRVVQTYYSNIDPMGVFVGAVEPPIADGIGTRDQRPNAALRALRDAAFALVGRLTPPRPIP